MMAFSEFYFIYGKVFIFYRYSNYPLDNSELFQLQMEFSFPFLRANDVRTSLLIMRTRSLSYVGLFLNLIANVVNNNDQHVQSGINVRMSQNPQRRRKMMGTGIIIARRMTITLRPGQGRAARQLHRGSDADADADVDADADAEADVDADADADTDVPHRVLTWLEDWAYKGITRWKIYERGTIFFTLCTKGRDCQSHLYQQRIFEIKGGRA